MGSMPPLAARGKLTVPRFLYPSGRTQGWIPASGLLMAAFGHHLRQKVESVRMGLAPAVPIPQSPPPPLSPPPGLAWHTEQGLAWAV